MEPAIGREDAFPLAGQCVHMHCYDIFQFDTPFCRAWNTVGEKHKPEVPALVSLQRHFASTSALKRTGILDDGDIVDRFADGECFAQVRSLFIVQYVRCQVLIVS